ncbi:hypothetical protein ACJMK2_037517 [Sinanodonta woodiana]|uniref:D-beta-hydroxybutyrate dehydrogenase, mitochondrial n=1 Tax=Sinanodonta woodiana TaxID=1069815 RepID=A0ABD3WP54_SINWO
MIANVFLYEVIFLSSFLVIPYFILVTSLWFYMCTGLFIYVLNATVTKFRKRKISISGQGIVISGCDTGFGHDLAKRLDDLGFTVFAGCLYPDENGAKILAGKNSKRLHIVPMDVGKTESMSEALEYVKAKLPKTGLWGIVSNAGFNVMGDVEYLTVDLYHKAMNVNFYGMLRLTKAFLPFVRKSRGRVVVVTSVRGLIPFPGDSAYHATKHALETVSDSLRMEMRKFGVHVSIIEPGNYGLPTACQDARQFERYEAEAEEMWRAASVDVKSTYRREYLTTMVDKQRSGTFSGSARTTEPVIDAFVDALLDVSPKTRYLVPGTPFDKNPMLARVYNILPQWLSDYILILRTGCDLFPSNSGIKQK